MPSTSAFSTSPLIYDDAISITANLSLHQLWPLSGTTEQPGPLNPPTELPTAGRPFVNLSFALNYFLSELDPAGYRATNLVIHFLSAVLLMLIVRRTLQLKYFASRFDHVAGPLAFAAAVLWAVHPLQTEAVAYITQRTELLMAFCYLATLYVAIRYWSAKTANSRTLWLVLAVVACAAGMASKEVMVSAPLAVLLYDWTFVTRSLRRSLRESWPLYTGLAATWLPLLALNYSAPRSASAGFHHSVSPWVWWATQAEVFWLYLKLTVWPWPLIIHYELPYNETWSDAWLWVALSAAVVLGTAVLLWRQRAAGFCLASVLIILAPTSIVPIVSEVAAERRMYLPLASLMSLAVVGGYSLMDWLRASRAANRIARTKHPLTATIAASLLMVVVASLISTRRLAAYENVTTLWRDTLVHQPDNFIANYNFACCLDAVGKTTEAVAYFERAVQLKPHVVRAHTSLADALLRAGRVDNALPHFEEAVRLAPENYAHYPPLAQAYVLANQPEKAIATAEKARQLARIAGQTQASEQIGTWIAEYRTQLASPGASPASQKSTSP